MCGEKCTSDPGIYEYPFKIIAADFRIQNEQFSEGKGFILRDTEKEV